MEFFLTTQPVKVIVLYQVEEYLFSNKMETLVVGAKEGTLSSPGCGNGDPPPFLIWRRRTPKKSTQLVSLLLSYLSLFLSIYPSFFFTSLFSLSVSLLFLSDYPLFCSIFFKTL